MESPFLKRNPLDVRALRRLAVIDQALAAIRAVDKKADEARSLCEESISFWEACVALAPEDVEINQGLLNTIPAILYYAIESDNEDAYDRWNAWATATLERSKVPPPARQLRGGPNQQISSSPRGALYVETPLGSSTYSTS